jgi:NAD(P)-dependent dehydrogenase (short-subunit alcohol dehydrogenase family)
MRIEGKVAIVTGGASGIGKAIAERFASEGATVCVADLDNAASEAVASSLPGSCFGLGLDVARADSIAALVNTVVARCGRIDILVNNAGTFDMSPVEDITRDQWHSIFSVNAEGMFFTLQAVAHEMITSGGGRIVNIASQSGRRGDPATLTYCAAKSAAISITQSAGLALIKHGITVNAIAPGPVDTPMWEKVDRLYQQQLGMQPGQFRRDAEAAIPFGRLAYPEDIASCALFLVSADSAYMTAQTLGVDGGNWMA